MARNELLQPANDSTSFRRWLGINCIAVPTTIIGMQGLDERIESSSVSAVDE